MSTSQKVQRLDEANCACDVCTGHRDARNTEMLTIVLDVKAHSLPLLRHCRSNGCVSHWVVSISTALQQNLALVVYK